MGGDQAYKGFGLGLMVEIFAGALSGGVCIREMPINQNGNCVFMQVFDPAHLGGREHFAGRGGRPGRVRPRLPADRRRERNPAARRPGAAGLGRPHCRRIPLDDGNWTELVKLAQELAVRHDLVS